MPDFRARLDQLLVERGLFATRSRASDAIQRGTVKVDGKAVTKPGQTAAHNAAITVDDPASAYVSRAALKLIAALDHFDLPHVYGSLEAAFAPVQAETLVVGFTSDWLFPPEQNRAIALALLRAGKRASYAELATDLGHDSFLLQSEALYMLVRRFLESTATPAVDFSI